MRNDNRGEEQQQRGNTTTVDNYQQLRGSMTTPPTDMKENGDNSTTETMEGIG